MTLGLGQLGGALLGGKMLDHYAIRNGAEIVGRHWVPYWLWPAGISGLVALLFWAAFREKIHLRPDTPG